MPKRHYVGIASLLGLCLTVTTACGGIGPVAAARVLTGPSEVQTIEPTGVPKGFKELGSVTNGLTVAVPENWIALDLSKDKLEEALKNTGMSGAMLEQYKQSLQILVDNKAIWASDLKSAKTSPNGFATNLNGVCQPSEQVPMDELISSAKSELEQLNAKVPEASEMPAGSGSVGRVVYTLEANGIEIKGTQYYMPIQGKICTVTLSTDQDGRQELFDRIGATMRPI